MRRLVELTLRSEGGFTLTEIAEMGYEQVVDYFGLIQLKRELKQEQEEEWFQELTPTRQ